MIRIRSALLCLLLLWGQFAVADSFIVKTVSLKHATANTIIPTLRPLLADGAHLSGTGDLLILKTTPENFRALLPVIQQLDRTPQMLIVSVSRSLHQNNTDTVIWQTANKQSDTQTLRLLSGSEGKFIFGKAIPVRQIATNINTGETVVGTEYRPLNSGIAVTPVVIGDRVQLTLRHFHTAQDRFGQTSIRYTTTETQITLPFNTWTAVSGNQQQSQDEEIISTLPKSDSNTALYVKVVRVE